MFLGLALGVLLFFTFSALLIVVGSSLLGVPLGLDHVSIYRFVDHVLYGDIYLFPIVFWSIWGFEVVLLMFVGWAL